MDELSEKELWLAMKADEACRTIERVMLDVEVAADAVVEEAHGFSSWRFLDTLDAVHEAAESLSSCLAGPCGMGVLYRIRKAEGIVHERAYRDADDGVDNG